MEDDMEPLTQKMLRILIDSSKLIPNPGNALFAVWKDEEAMLDWSRAPAELRVATASVQSVEGILELPPAEHIPRDELAILGTAYAATDGSKDIVPQTVLFCHMKKEAK